MTEPDNPLPMRPYRLVFAVRDRDGNEVRLTESQWTYHIAHEHAEVEPHLEEIRGVIEDPQIIAAGREDEVFLLTLGAVSRRSRQYLKVVVNYSDEVTGRRIGSVRTAFFTGRRPKERILYESEPSQD